MAWICAGLTAVVAPIATVIYFSLTPDPPPWTLVGGPILAVALMGAGIIGAAAAGRFATGVLLSLIGAGTVIAVASVLVSTALINPLALVIAALVASISFAARGALFARSMEARGWWMALAVVAGEGAIVVTALADPAALPRWLLVLLPAQWATIAVQNALAGAGAFAASSALIALGGTAAATMLVTALWPRRWTYVIMFTVWLSLSALVYHRPAPPLPNIDDTVAGWQFNAP
jgi:hypothetical protein